MNLAKFSFRTDAGNSVDIEVSKDHKIVIFVDGKPVMVLSNGDSKEFYKAILTSRELIHVDVNK